MSGLRNQWLPKERTENGTHLLEILVGHRAFSLQVAADVFLLAGQDRCGVVVVVVDVVFVVYRRFKCGRRRSVASDDSHFCDVLFSTTFGLGLTDVGPTHEVVIRQNRMNRRNGKGEEEEFLSALPAAAAVKAAAKAAATVLASREEELERDGFVLLGPMRGETNNERSSL